jgi:hypothetical protein
MEGQKFFDMNQVLQKNMIHENRAKDHRLFCQFKECNSWDKERP